MYPAILFLAGAAATLALMIPAILVYTALKLLHLERVLVERPANTGDPQRRTPNVTRMTESPRSLSGRMAGRGMTPRTATRS